MYSLKLAHHRADIKARRDPVDGILPVRGGGGTPLILKVKGPTPQQMKYKGGHTGLKY
ncbi:unnamed protein product [Symbiodinium sp. CCMP2592]|nr:unnamed protein product [Symbiodinium sp. CCMP2592]